MYGELGSIREAVALSPQEVLDGAAVLLVQQGYEVAERTETSVTGIRHKRKGLFGRSVLGLTVSARPLPQGVEVKLEGNDREGVRERQAEWSAWAKDLPKANRIQQEHEPAAPRAVPRAADPEAEARPEASGSEVREEQEAGGKPSGTGSNDQPAAEAAGAREMGAEISDERAGDHAGTWAPSGEPSGWASVASWDRKLPTATGKQEQETAPLGRAGGADAGKNSADREWRGTRTGDEAFGGTRSGSREKKEEPMTDSGMERHTISVGTDTLGETVAFTANCLGTAAVNGGSGGGGMDMTFYRLPDNTYRTLIETDGISLLEPSDFTEVLGTDRPATYGRWTYEEAERNSTYGEMFTKFMQQHPEGRKRIVRDLD